MAGVGGLLRDLKFSFDRSVKRRGLGGTIAAGLSRPGSLRRFRRQLAADDDFDAQYGVDTGGVVALSDLSISSENSVFGTFYGATNSERFREIIGRLDLDLSQFTFIDYGSGKGKALLLASQYPFARIIGVEFAAELNVAARSNIERYTGPRQSGPIDVLDADATAFELPNTPLVLYFCNPFEAEVMQGVLARVKAAAGNGHPIWALYYNPRMAQEFEAAGFQLVHREAEDGPMRQSYAIYRVS